MSSSSSGLGLSWWSLWPFGDFSLLLDLLCSGDDDELLLSHLKPFKVREDFEWKWLLIPGSPGLFFSFLLLPPPVLQVFDCAPFARACFAAIFSKRNPSLGTRNHTNAGLHLSFSSFAIIATLSLGNQPFLQVKDTQKAAHQPNSTRLVSLSRPSFGFIQLKGVYVE